MLTDKYSFRESKITYEGYALMRMSIGISSAVLLAVIVISMFSSPPAFAVTSSGTWSKTYGGPNWDVAYALAQTSDDGYALAGFTESFGAGAIDFWLVKTDASGNMLWNKTYGGPYADEAYSVVQTSDGRYALAGDTWSPASGTQFWLVKTDSSGNMLWSNTYGTGTAYSMVQTSDGGYALAGETSSGAGEGDFMLVKTDSNGGVSHFPFLLILGVSVGVFVIVILLTVIRAKRKGHVSAVEHESEGAVKANQSAANARVAVICARMLVPKFPMRRPFWQPGSFLISFQMESLISASTRTPDKQSAPGLNSSPVLSI